MILPERLNTRLTSGVATAKTLRGRSTAMTTTGRGKVGTGSAVRRDPGCRPVHQVTQCKKDLQQANRGEWLCGTGAPGWVEGQLPSNVGDKVHPHSPALTELPTRWTVGCASATRMTTASGRQTSRSLHVTASSFTTFLTPQSAPLDTVVLTEWTNTRNGLDPNTCSISLPFFYQLYNLNLWYTVFSWVQYPEGAVW